MKEQLIKSILNYLLNIKFIQQLALQPVPIETKNTKR